jgi:small ligand-binding sensory domain FIST
VPSLRLKAYGEEAFRLRSKQFLRRIRARLHWKSGRLRSLRVAGLIMAHDHAVSGTWADEFDEVRLQQWAENLRAGLTAPKVTLGLIFISPRFFNYSRQILEIVRVHAQISLLAGCSSQWLIADDREIEEQPGIVLGLYHLPGADLRPYYSTQKDLEQADSPTFWHVETGIGPSATNGWLVFADPFNLDADSWLRQWNEAYHGLPILGGLASGDWTARSTQVYLNGDVYEEGAVAISIGGEIELASVISQGCTPIGETWTITRTDQNLIFEIGNRPAYEVLLETYTKLRPDEQKKSQGNLFIGLVMNEYLEDFHRGDFLIRNLIGVDPKAGVIAVGALPRPGQTMQFQRRDAGAANEDMAELLNRAHEQLKNRTIYGGCLCSCNGRGSGLFGYPNHDAGMIQRRLGPFALTGFFCNGEIGPVGEKNFLHGYTASLALFVKKERKEGK